MNLHGVIPLSHMLAESRLASQHHICAPSYSGTARKYYGRLRLDYHDYFSLQNQIDANHIDWKSKGLFVTFNSFWPVTGQRSRVVGGSRTITLQQLVEQTKDSYIIIRPNGDFRLTGASWGRETVGDAVIGNIHHQSADDLFCLADQLYRTGKIMQLPRATEALHKFQIGKSADASCTNEMLGKEGDPQEVMPMIPIIPLSENSILNNPISQEEIAAIAEMTRLEPDKYRFAKHVSGVYLMFDRTMSQVILLKEDEWLLFAESYKRIEINEPH